MHAVWACTVCACHAQNAGLFTVIGIPPEENVLSNAKMIGFVVLTGVQAIINCFAFYFCHGVDPAKVKSN